MKQVFEERGVNILKLDYECVRNILLSVESLETNQSLHDEDWHEFPLLKSYSAQEISYAVSRLKEAGFIPQNSVVELMFGIRYNIDALTWDGHQYLDCIRDENVWEQVRQKASRFSGVPLKFLADVGMMIMRSGVGLPS